MSADLSGKSSIFTVDDLDEGLDDEPVEPPPGHLSAQKSQPPASQNPAPVPSAELKSRPRPSAPPVSSSPPAPRVSSSPPAARVGRSTPVPASSSSPPRPASHGRPSAPAPSGRASAPPSAPSAPPRSAPSAPPRSAPAAPPRPGGVVRYGRAPDPSYALSVAAKCLWRMRPPYLERLSKRFGWSRQRRRR